MSASTPKLLISAGLAHGRSPPDLLGEELPIQLRDRAPKFPNVRLYESHQQFARWWLGIRKMPLDRHGHDGTAAEVLHPNAGQYFS